MKVTLIHCYSDDNRGDCGIIYSIHQLIKNNAPDVIINAMSVFNSNDNYFKDGYKFTNEIFTKIYPSFFPEPNIFFGIFIKNSFLKLLIFSRYLIINLLILLTKSKYIAKLFFSDNEYRSFVNFIESDIIISKGGSFLYSFKGLNGIFFFIRMIYPFILAKRFGNRSYIFSQSVGPFENYISKFIFRYVSPNIDGIYLREKNCINEIEKSHKNLKVITDAAFSMEVAENRPKTKRISVGITARPHNFKIKAQEHKYFEALSKLIKHLTMQGIEVHLVPQVIGPTKLEDDRLVLKKLYSKFSKNQLVFYHSDNLSPRDLKSLYGTMHFMIGTRLHSIIFAMGMGVPSIAIAYHGTKAEGIMESIGMSDYILSIETISFEFLKSKFEDLMLKRNQLESRISNQLTILNESLNKAIIEILKNYK